MFRWLIVCTLLAAGTVTVMYLVFGPIQNPASVIGGESKLVPVPQTPKPAPGDKQATATSAVEERVSVKPLSVTEMANGGKLAAAQNRIVIPNGRVYMIDRQDVPSERDGKLIGIATDIGVETASEDKLVRDVPYAFLVVEMIKAEQPNQSTLVIDGKRYRRLLPNEELQPERMKVYRANRKLRKLQVGEQVTENQLLAVVNPSLAIDELTAKLAKLDAAEADVRVSGKTKDEAEKRYNSAATAFRGRAISEDDFRASKLAWDRYKEEETSKLAAVRQAKAELQAAVTGLQMYEVRASVAGTIKQIYKNARGEAVKNLESILSIQSPEMLRVEATVEVQVARALKLGMDALIEAAHPEPPLAVLSGHRQDVTCIAVSKGPNPMILSGSEDRTVRVWVKQQDGRWAQRWEIQPPAAIRALACTGPDAQRNLALIGAADGSVYLLDLDHMTEPAQPMATGHRKPVNCVAFSPDGTVCASGDDDRSINLWNTAERQRLGSGIAHKSHVTSLQFASADRLLSAGQDGRLLAWDVRDPANPKSVELVDRRSGSVTKLGVSPDGTHVLVDQGKELRRLSLVTGQMEGVITNSNEALTFSDMALFSPDGLCVLTNGPGEGRLQLWRTPTAASRADELRQFIWTNGAATCGAFAPDATFAVTGTKDNQVLIWDMPKREKDSSGHLQLVEPPLQATLTLVDKTLDSTTRQVRVWAELKGREWLTPGSTATIVVPMK